MPRFKLEVNEILDELARLYPDAKCALLHTNPFELLIATMLSAQSTDKMVNTLTPALFQRFPHPQELASADLEEVERLIAKCGLYKTKAKNLIATSQQLVDQYSGEVPASLEALVTLPGVGRKTANVVLSNAFAVPAIAVDTHVQRVSNRIGLAKSDDVYETEQQLMRKIPKKLWSTAHHWLIYHGRMVCTARSPKCTVCSLQSRCRQGQQSNKSLIVTN